MPASLWSDPGTWIALGVSVLTLAVAWAMHRIIVKVLKAPSPDLPSQPNDFPKPHPSGSATGEQLPTESNTP